MTYNRERLNLKRRDPMYTCIRVGTKSDLLIKFSHADK